MDNAGKYRTEERTAVVIAAAGASLRMGQCKFLLPMKDGRTVLEHVIDAFRHDFIHRIVVVTQARYAASIEALALDDRVEIVSNKAPELERFFSVQLGVLACDQDDYIFIHNADMPLIDKAVIEALHSERDSIAYVAPVNNSKGGHPILINRLIADELFQFPASEQLNNALGFFRRKLVEVTNEGILIDIDDPETYKKLVLSE